MTATRVLSRWTVTWVLVALALAGGFYSGARFTAASPRPAAAVATPPPAQFRPGGFGGPGGFGRPVVAGRVVSVGSGSFVVHDTQTATDVTVYLGSGARFTQTSTAQASALKPSQSVTVVGEAKQDGSVTASSVAIVTGR